MFGCRPSQPQARRGSPKAEPAPDESHEPRVRVARSVSAPAGCCIRVNPYPPGSHPSPPLSPAPARFPRARPDQPAPQLAVSDHAADPERLVSHLPQLASLKLAPLWPALLERVLGALPASVALRRLQVEVVVAEEADADSARLEGAGGWLDTLERCVGLPGLFRLVELDVGPGLRTAGPEPVWWPLAGADLAAFLDSREGARDGWDAFRAKVAEAGGKLLCWSKPHDELVEMVALSQTDGP